MEGGMLCSFHIRQIVFDSSPDPKLHKSIEDFKALSNTSCIRIKTEWQTTNNKVEGGVEKVEWRGLRRWSGEDGWGGEDGVEGVEWKGLRVWRGEGGGVEWRRLSGEGWKGGAARAERVEWRRLSGEGWEGGVERVDGVERVQWRGWRGGGEGWEGGVERVGGVERGVERVEWVEGGGVEREWVEWRRWRGGRVRAEGVEWRSNKHIARIYEYIYISSNLHSWHLSPPCTAGIQFICHILKKNIFLFPGQFETIEAMDSMKLQLHAGPQGDGKEIHVDDKKVRWLEWTVICYLLKLLQKNSFC